MFRVQQFTYYKIPFKSVLAFRSEKVNVVLENELEDIIFIDLVVFWIRFMNSIS